MNRGLEVNTVGFCNDRKFYYKDECLLNDIMDNIQYDKDDIGLNDDEVEKLSSAKTYDDFVNTAYDILDEGRYNILDGIIQNIKDGIDMYNFCARIQFVLEPDSENSFREGSVFGQYQY